MQDSPTFVIPYTKEKPAASRITILVKYNSTF